MKPPVKFEWRGNHHGYFGIFFIVFGLFNHFMGIDNAELTNLIPLWQGFVVMGAFIALDDIIEHKITKDTPLRLLYVKVIRPWLIKLKH